MTGKPLAYASGYDQPQLQNAALSSDTQHYPAKLSLE
jgi:hypothetical protein